MKRTLSIVIMLAMLLAVNVYAAETEPEAAAPTHDVLVLFTSDVHCGVDQNFGYVGLQAVRDAAETAGDHVLLVDDGDPIQGEPIGTMT